MTEIDFIQPKKTVGKLISVDVLDKILDEIWDIDDEIVLNPDSLECKIYVRAIKVIDIINKYKAESEDKG